MRFLSFAFIVALSFIPSFALSAKNCSLEMNNDGKLPAFLAYKTGMVQHVASGLIFKQCLEGQSFKGAQCAGAEKFYTWLDAEKLAMKLHFGGYDDWRLPKLEELQTLVDPSCQKPVVNRAYFSSLSDQQIWTASPGAPVNDHSVVLDVGDGQIFGVGRQGKRSVLLVRGVPRQEWLEREPPSDWVSR